MPKARTRERQNTGPEAPGGEWVTLARLVRPRGVKGEILADILTDFPERFEERRRLYLRASLLSAEVREVALERHWMHQGRVVLKFVGIDTMTAAESLRGLEVVIPMAERAPLEEGAVYIGDLVGCVLFDRRTATGVGAIVAVDRESSNMELLVVETPGGGEMLVPFARAYEPQLDLAGRRMEMTLPEGLVELEGATGDESDGAPGTRRGKKG